MKLPFISWQPEPDNVNEKKSSNVQEVTAPKFEAKKPSIRIKQEKSMAEKDAELTAKLEGISGEGGEAGVELENGKAVGLKRGVKENMFRII